MQFVILESLLMKLKVALIRSFLIGLWLLVFLNQVFEFTNFWKLLFNVLGLVILIAHLIEYFVIKSKITDVSQRGRYHFFMIIIFGAAYWWPLIRAQRPGK